MSSLSMTSLSSSTVADISQHASVPHEHLDDSDDNGRQQLPSAVACMSNGFERTTGTVMNAGVLELHTGPTEVRA